MPRLDDLISQGSSEIATPRYVSERDSWRTLKITDVDLWLSLYPLDHRFLTNLQYARGIVRGVVIPHTAAYTHATVPYYTACQTVLLASQMSYVLAGACYCDPAMSVLPFEQYELFLQRLRTVQLYYTQMQLRFRKKMSNAVAVPIQIQLRRARHTARLAVVQARFAMDTDGASCDISLAMPIREEVIEHV